MGRKRLDEDSETTTETFRLPKDLKREFIAMCRVRDKDRSVIYRDIMIKEIRRWRLIQRLKEKTKETAA